MQASLSKLDGNTQLIKLFWFQLPDSTSQWSVVTTHDTVLTMQRLQTVVYFKAATWLDKNHKVG
jgi:hypothetical protein